MQNTISGKTTIPQTLRPHTHAVIMTIYQPWHEKKLLLQEHAVNSTHALNIE
jgi:hypothetical protein